MVNPIPEGCAEEGEFALFGKERSTRRLIGQNVKRQVHALGVGLWAGEDVVWGAIYVNEGRACVKGSAAADGTFVDRRGERSSTRRQSWWRAKYRWWMDGRKDNDSDGLV